MKIDESGFEPSVAEEDVGKRAEAGVRRRKIVPLTEMQLGILYQSISTDDGVYVVSNSMTIEGDVSEAHFSEAWREVTCRHPILKAQFVWKGLSRPVQIIEETMEPAILFADWSDRSATVTESDWKALVADAEARRFDLEAGPLLRVDLVRMGRDTHRMIATFHHLVIDGWSLAVVMRDVLDCYGQAAGYLKTRRYVDTGFEAFALRESSRDTRHSRHFWSSYLEGHEAAGGLRWIEAPRSSIGSGNVYRHTERQLDDSAASHMARACREYGLTPNTLVHAAWSIVLSLGARTGTVVYGMTVSGRPSEIADSADMVGLFIKTLPVRVAPAWQQRTAEWLTALQLELAELREHDAVSLLDIQVQVGVTRGEGLFDSILVFENYPVPPEGDRGGLQVKDVRITENTHYPVTVLLSSHRGLGAKVIHDRRVIGDADADGLLVRLLETVEALCEHMDVAVGQSLIPKAERQRVLEHFGALEREGPEPTRRLETLVREQARRSPRAEAVRCGEQTLDYATLAAQAEALAQRLRRCGAGRGSVVGVYLERSVELPGVLLGILEAGAAYLPLDPELPRERLEYMVGDAGCAVVVSAGALAEQVPGSARGLRLEAEEEDPLAESVAGGGGGLEDAAYVIYTSGSTGRPKGVIVPHRGVVNRLLWMREHYDIGAQDRVLQKTPFGFDVSVWELFVPLMAGARLVMACPGGHRDPLYLAQEIEERGITIVHFVPSMLRQYTALAPACASVRLVAASGEALGAEQPAAVARCFPGARTDNLYGPTEASVDVSSWRCEPEAVGPVPIGRPIANTQLYVLDDRGEVQPVGVAGELYIGGMGVARGYLGRPGQTAERFVPDPFGSGGGRLYRSGDLARWRADGALEYLGRNDDQVKVRGHRIELGEVEAALREVPGVEGAAVVATEDASGDLRLVGYVTGEVDLAKVKARVGERLPGYMVPSVLMGLEALPLTPSGKLDRGALPAPEGLDGCEESGEYEAPEGPLEEALGRIWCELLGLERVGRHDNFFALGGDSILALMVVSRSAAVQIVLTPRQVFENPTIQQAAYVFGESADDCASASEMKLADEGVWLPAQHWFLDQKLRYASHWNLSVLLAPKDPLTVSVFRTAVQVVVARHPALRVGCSDDGSQVVLSSDKELSSLVTAVRLSRESDELREYLDEANASLDLATGLVFRAALIDLSDGSQRISLVAHHFAIDVVSWTIVIENIERLLSKPQAVLPARDTETKRYLRQLWEWTKSEQAEAARDFWTAFGASGAKRLPRDFMQTSNVQGDSSLVRRTLPASVTNRLLSLGAKGFEALQLASLTAAVADWSDARTVDIMLEGHGRLGDLVSVDLSSTVGWFTTFHPCRLSPAEGIAPAAVARAMITQLDAAPGGAVGYGALRYLSEDGQRYEVEPEISFNYLGRGSETSGEDRALQLVPIVDVETRNRLNRRPFVLEFVSYLENECLHAFVEYSHRLHSSDTVSDLLEKTMAMMEVMSDFSSNRNERRLPKSGSAADERNPQTRRLSRVLGEKG